MSDIVERLRFCENYEWSPLMHEAAAEIEWLRGEAADRTKKVECLWALSDARKNEIERLRTDFESGMERFYSQGAELDNARAEITRLQSCLYAQESVPQLYAEIKRLRTVGDAVFYAMCAYRDDNSDDALGIVLSKEPSHDR